MTINFTTDVEIYLVTKKLSCVDEDSADIGLNPSCRIRQVYRDYALIVSAASRPVLVVKGITSRTSDR